MLQPLDDGRLNIDGHEVLRGTDSGKNSPHGLSLHAWGNRGLNDWGYPGVHAIVKLQHIGLIPTPLLHAYGGGALETT